MYYTLCCFCHWFVLYLTWSSIWLNELFGLSVEFVISQTRSLAVWPRLRTLAEEPVLVHILESRNCPFVFSMIRDYKVFLTLIFLEGEWLMDNFPIVKNYHNCVPSFCMYWLNRIFQVYRNSNAMKCNDYNHVQHVSTHRWIKKYKVGCVVVCGYIW